MAEDDDAGMVALTAALGHRVQIVGDDYLATIATRIAHAAARGACNAALLKPNQAGTVSETRAAMAAAQHAHWGTIVSARSGETEDTTVAHLAVGQDAGQLKVGSFARSERMAKWNQCLRIERELGADAVYAGGDALPLAPDHCLSRRLTPARVAAIAGATGAMAAMCVSVLTRVRVRG